jgi:hypothetical protein
LDSNVLVSYLLVHRPPITDLIDDHLAADDFALLTCGVLLEELERVLRYPRLARYVTADRRTRFLALILALGELVDLPDVIPPICRDPADDVVIACAVAGGADAIVSGDRDLLALGHVGGIPVLTAAQFLELLDRRGPEEKRSPDLTGLADL